MATIESEVCVGDVVELESVRLTVKEVKGDSIVIAQFFSGSILNEVKLNLMEETFPVFVETKNKKVWKLNKQVVSL